MTPAPLKCRGQRHDPAHVGVREFGGRRVDLDHRVLVGAVVDVTPDSFHRPGTTFRFEDALAAGETPVAELEQLTREYPFHERPHGLLMRALYADGRQREALAPGACREVAVVVGFQTAAWIGRHDQSPPPLGRLCWHATSTLDGRGRVVLDRRARAYLAVDDPAAFDVVVLRPAGGGLLLVPVDGVERRLQAVAA